MTTIRTLAILSLLTAAAACGGGEAYSGGGDDGDDGGNVGFGGAQDIGQFRGILDAGGIPGVETLDANGFFAEHYSPLPPADCGQVICLEPMLSVGREWLQGRYQATLQIAMTTPVDPATLPRLPLNLVVVVDHSGSMSEDGRMEKVKQGLHILIDSLQPGDRLALVKFDSVVTPLTDLATDPDPAVLHQHVEALYPRGSTNIYDGLQTGFSIASAAWSPDRQNRVMLLSDGLATAGITDQASIMAMADGYLLEGMSLTTIGVGLSFDVELMRGLAEHGAGNFYFLEDATAVNEVFTQELEYSLTTLALDLAVNAVPATGYRFGDVTGTRVWSSTSDGGEARIPAVFVASRTDQNPEGGRRGGGGSIFIDLTPIAGAIGNGTVATVNLTYRIPGSQELIEQTVTVANPFAPGESPEQPYVSIQAMLEHYAAYNMYLGFHHAAYLAQWDYNCALGALEALRVSANLFQSGYSDPDIAADLVLLEQFAENLRARGAYVAGGDGSSYCADYQPGDGPDDGWDDDFVEEEPLMMCSTGGGASGALMLLLIGGAVVVARRRRAA
jgi:Ca-activated chloride channel family protein